MWHLLPKCQSNSYSSSLQRINMLVCCEVHLLGDWGERAMRWYVYKRFKNWQTFFLTFGRVCKSFPPQVPEMRVVLKSKPLACERVRRDMTALFTVHGIAPERINCAGTSARLLPNVDGQNGNRARVGVGTARKRKPKSAFFFAACNALRRFGCWRGCSWVHGPAGILEGGRFLASSSSSGWYGCLAASSAGDTFSRVQTTCPLCLKSPPPRG